jgi:transposase/ribosomal protein L29
MENSGPGEAELLHAIKELTTELAALRSELAMERAARENAEKQVKDLRQQIAELTARLGTDSSNSSKPPSSDPPAARPRSLRRKTGRKPGGQTGHAGATLQMSPAPDLVEEHRPRRCHDCGRQLSGWLTPVAVEARQVFDLPGQLALEVVEHRLASLCCPACHHVTKADAPPEAPRQVQYGPKMEAAAVYLGTSQYLPVKRASELIRDWFGATISPATIEKMTGRAAAVIETSVKPAIADLLAAGPVAHADETGFKVAGKTLWAHSPSNPKATWIEVHQQRGKAAIDKIGLIPRLTGVLVHDAWAAYDSYPNIGGHQLRTAHVLRECQAVIDHHDHSRETDWCWAGQVSDALTDMIHDPATADRQRSRIKAALNAAEERDPDMTGKLGQKHAALRRRLRNRLDDHTRFTTDPAIPPTNNPAEQEIRMVKIKQKISGTMRTIQGARAFTTIRSYLATARKHGIKPLHALTSLTTPKPWLPATP